MTLYPPWGPSPVQNYLQDGASSQRILVWTYLSNITLVRKISRRSELSSPPPPPARPPPGGLVGPAGGSATLPAPFPPFPLRHPDGAAPPPQPPDLPAAPPRLTAPPYLPGPLAQPAGLLLPPRHPGRRPRPPHPSHPRQPAHRDTELAGQPQQMHQVTYCLPHPPPRLTLGDNPYSPLPLLPPGLGVRPAGRRLKHLHLDSAGLRELPAPVLQCR